MHKFGSNYCSALPLFLAATYLHAFLTYTVNRNN